MARDVAERPQPLRTDPRHPHLDLQAQGGERVHGCAVAEKWSHFWKIPRFLDFALWSCVVNLVVLCDDQSGGEGRFRASRDRFSYFYWWFAF